MKKILSFIAVAVLFATATMVTSCERQAGDVIFTVSVSFDDNMDLLTSAIDEGFKDAGFTNISLHTWKLTGEVNSCKNKAKKAFQARCQAIDKDRNLIGGLGSYLALKGEKVTLNFIYGSSKEEYLDEYTFVEEDLK